jgi:hypothetical protein
MVVPDRECAKGVVFSGESLHNLWQWWWRPWGVALPAEGTIEEYQVPVARFSWVKTQPSMGVRRRRHQCHGLLGGAASGDQSRIVAVVAVGRRCCLVRYGCGGALVPH